MHATQQGVRRLTNLTTGGPVHVDVADGRIQRIVPLQLDETDAPSWTIEARGRSFTPPRKTTLSPWTVGHRATIYSPNRILTPLKRVDFDPDGKRNTTEPRRVRLRAHLLGRRARHGRRRDGAHQARVRPRRHADDRGLAPPVGQRRLPLQRVQPVHEPRRLHLRRAQPRQLGRLAVGRRPHVGLQPPPRHPGAVRPPRGRAQAHRDDGVLVGRPRDDRRGVRLVREHLAPLLAQGARGQDGLHRPLPQPDLAAVRRQVAGAATGDRRGARPGDRAHVARRGHLRQGVRRRAHSRLRRVAGLRARQERQRAQDAGVGRDRVRPAGPPDPGARPRVGPPDDDARRRRHGWLGRRLPRLQRQRVVAGHDRPGGHAGHGQAGQQHLVDHERRAVRPVVLLPRLRRGRHLGRHRRHRRRQEARRPHVAGGRHLLQPAALARGPDRPAPAHPRGDEPRAPRVARQGLLRLVDRVPVPRVPLPGRRVPARADVLPLRRLVHRHDDGDQPLRARLPRGPDPVRREPVHLDGGRGEVRRHRPAGLHQLRALGHRRLGARLGLRHAQVRAGEPPADRARAAVHRAARREQVRLRDLRRSSPASSASATSTRRAA